MGKYIAEVRSSNENSVSYLLAHSECYYPPWEQMLDLEIIYENGIIVLVDDFCCSIVKAISPYILASSFKWLKGAWLM